MAVIRDVMPAFELFQPATIEDALALLDRHGSDACEAMLLTGEQQNAQGGRQRHDKERERRGNR